jgi:DNA-binding NtrC family response regulator
VVDDDRDLADTLADILSFRGWRASALYSGEAAVAQVRETPPDAVVMDIRMPGVDGVEALRRMLQHWPGLPVLLMTGYADRDLIDQARREGAVRIFDKPVHPDDLVRALTTALGGGGGSDGARGSNGGPLDSDDVDDSDAR